MDGGHPDGRMLWNKDEAAQSSLGHSPNGISAVGMDVGKINEDMSVLASAKGGPRGERREAGNKLRMVEDMNA